MVIAAGDANSALHPLPLGAVKPRGWLAQQLRTQAEGLSGHLYEFWPDVGPNSGWLGGSGESWERGPYYADGLVPLAYLTGDPKLLAIANKFIEWTLINQRADGAIGPPKNTDWWPNMVMLKALAQYQEATGDGRVVPLMQRYFRYHLDNADARPLEKWASFRWQDEVWSLLWLYDRTGDKSLLDLARKLKAQGHDWQAQFADLPYRGKSQKANTDLRTHIVNNTQALKTSAVWFLVTGDRRDREAIYRHFEEIERYHLLPNGLISGDEHLAGLDPSQGTELCAVVEGMFSLENVLAVTGDAQFGDRLEKWAYNGLPGTFDAKMWAHQYDQQPNQVLCNVYPRNWTSNKPDSNLFGLEPNFGCCTANYHQGWPKFVSHLWMKGPKDSLVAVAYGPNEVNTALRGVDVNVTEETDYPFRGTIRLILSPATAIEFPLMLRIPAWADAAVVKVNGNEIRGTQAGAFVTTVHRWKKGDRVDITFPMRVRATRWMAGSAALERGPLIFSLAVGEDWRKLKDHKFESADWEVHPTTPWNYALRLDPAAPEKAVVVEERAIGKYPWNAEGAPVVMKVRASRVPQWTLVDGSAGPLPDSPVKTADAAETVTFLPYGAAKLRVTALPLAR